jgi:UDP-N-acetylmuramoyl-tripeptide--D-alanyl-D-alanine ligase
MKSIFKKIITLIIEAEARAVLKKYKPTVVAITGSVGKTSAKDAIYTVLASTSTYVRKSQKSFNSEIGVPLTVLGCENGWNDPFLWLENIFHGLELIFFKNKYPECLVLEIGADHPGDIKRTTKWVKPDVVVVTKVSMIPVHVEFFPSRADLLREKSFLAQAVKKGGTLVLSEDDEDVKNMASLVPAGIDPKVITFGFRHSAAVNASNESIMYEDKEGVKTPHGISFTLNNGGESIPLHTEAVLGTPHVYPFLAAAAVGISRGMKLADIAKALEKNVPPKGRMNLLPGINGSVLIDDTYNASPDAVHEALVTLSKLETTGKKIAVLGDMMELGKFSTDEHKKVGEFARKVATTVVTVGQRTKAMNADASFNTSMEAAEYVKGIVGRGDVVLVKGSQSMRMERVVKAVLREDMNARDVLVRQEEEWLKKA